MFGPVQTSGCARTSARYSSSTSRSRTVWTNPSIPARNVRELVALAKRHPGKLNYGSIGPGTINHLTGALFAHAAGIDIAHVPDKGGVPGLHALLAGDIELQVSRPLDGVWVPYDANTMKLMQADYKRLWDTGLLSDLTFSITDYTFPNGVIGKLIAYTLKER